MMALDDGLERGYEGYSGKGVIGYEALYGAFLEGMSYF